MFGQGRRATEGDRGKGRRRDALECDTSGHLARAEFGEGMGHLWLAANHGAESVKGQVRPRLRTVRAVTLVPLAAAVRAGTEQVGKAGRKASAKAPRTKGAKMSSKRTKLLVGLLAVGAAAGVTGALVARRRRAEWEEYEAAGQGTMHTDTGTGLVAGAAEFDRGITEKRTAHEWAAAKEKAGADGARFEKSKAEQAKEKISEPLDLTAKQFADNATPSRTPRTAG